MPQPTSRHALPPELPGERQVDVEAGAFAPCGGSCTTSGCLPPIDKPELLRLLVEQGELRDFERERIRRLAAQAAERLGADKELFSGERGVGPDADAVALGELLEHHEAGA